jgi:hypothetical protein
VIDHHHHHHHHQLLLLHFHQHRKHQCHLTIEEMELRYKRFCDICWIIRNQAYAQFQKDHCFNESVYEG